MRELKKANERAFEMKNCERRSSDKNKFIDINNVQNFVTLGMYVSWNIEKNEKSENNSFYHDHTNYGGKGVLEYLVNIWNQLVFRS